MLRCAIEGRALLLGTFVTKTRSCGNGRQVLLELALAQGAERAPGSKSFPFLLEGTSRGTARFNAPS
jgi:hypothetical protein